MGNLYQPMGIRKAQASPYATQVWNLPIRNYGKPALYSASLTFLIIARSLSEVPVRVAIEQIKM